MNNAITRWVVLTVSVWAAALIVPGISYEGWPSILIAALILSILNSLVKPVLQLISLPFIVMSLGLFLLVINALVLRLTAWLVEGFHVAGFWPAVGGSVVISIVSMFLGYSRRPVARTVIIEGGGRSDDRRSPPPGSGPIIDV